MPLLLGIGILMIALGGLGFFLLGVIVSVWLIKKAINLVFLKIPARLWKKIKKNKKKN